MKKQMLALLLVCCVALLSACSSQTEVFPVATDVPTQSLLSSPTQAPAAATEAASTVIDFDDGSYDPSSEEGGEMDDEVIELGADATNAPIDNTAVPTVNSEYAGATPVPIDPIDKPTPTPLPALSFSDYATYEATRLHVSFQAPSGWTVDDSELSAYTIVNPDTGMTFQAYITVTAESVSSAYSSSQLTTTVNNMIAAIKSSGSYSSFSAKKAASRTLMDKNGIYNDFTATTTSGDAIYGRVQATCIDRVLYTVTIVCPNGYWESAYKNVYNKIRSTMMITQ